MWTRVWPFVAAAIALTWAGAQGLLCACNTAACRDQGQETCNATAMCYVQFLDLGDESDPIIRGCIASKTPLLCENRRPALAASWPVLVCCAHSPMCNKDTVPGNLPTTSHKVASTPDAHQPSSTVSSSSAEPNSNKAMAAVYSSKGSETTSRHQQAETVPLGSAPSHDHQSERGAAGAGGGGGLSAAYAALLAVACSLLVLVAGALALFLLRRRTLSITSGQYGAMHGGYFKGQAPRDCADPEASLNGLCGKRPPASSVS